MFNVKKCEKNLDIKDDKKKIFNLDRENRKLLDDVLKRCPKSDTSVSSIDDFEPYYILFSKLGFNGNKIMYMLADEFQCGLDPSTGIYVNEVRNENLVCIHSWYARERNGRNIERIRKLYQISLNMIKGSRCSKDFGIVSFS